MTAAPTSDREPWFQALERAVAALDSAATIVGRNAEEVGWQTEVHELLCKAWRDGRAALDEPLNTTRKETTMDTNSPEFKSLLAAAIWWRDYATNLSEGRNVFPKSPYPALCEYTPAPPPGVAPAANSQKEPT